MKVGVVSSNATWTGDIVRDLNERGHEVLLYEHTADPIQQAFQVGQIKAWADRVFIDWAQEPMLSVMHAVECPITVRLHRLEVYQDVTYTYPGPEGQPLQVPWDQVDNLIFVSDHVRERFCAFAQERGTPPPKRIHTIKHVGVDTSVFVPPKERDWSEGPFRIFLPGRLVTKKRQYTAVQLFYDIEQQWPGMFRLHIVGDTTMGGYGNQEYHINIADLIVDLGLQEKMWAGPAVDFENMPAEYEASHLVLNTTNEEGACCTVVEGMSAGCIPLIGNWRGSDGLYPEKWIWKSPLDLYRLIERFVEMTPKQRQRWSREARKFAAERYERADIIKRTVDIILGPTQAEYYDGMLEHFIQQRDNPRNVAGEDLFLPFVDKDTELLEIGCSIGRQCEAAARAGAKRVVGVDLAPRVIQYARTQAAEKGLSIEYFAGEVPDAMPAGEWSLVLLLDVLEHMRPDKYVGLWLMLGTTVKPGGRIVITFPYKAQPAKGEGQLAEYRVFPKVVRNQLQKNGFEIETFSPMHDDESQFLVVARKPGGDS